MLPRSGDIIVVSVAASVQFAATTPFQFRLIRVHDWTCAPGWAWLDGYQLDASGDAVERRSLYLRVDGVDPCNAPRQVVAPARRRSGNSRAQQYDGQPPVT